MTPVKSPMTGTDNGRVVQQHYAAPLLGLRNDGCRAVAGTWACAVGAAVTPALVGHHSRQWLWQRRNSGSYPRPAMTHASASSILIPGSRSPSRSFVCGRFWVQRLDDDSQHFESGRKVGKPEVWGPSPWVPAVTDHTTSTTSAYPNFSPRRQPVTSSQTTPSDCSGGYFVRVTGSYLSVLRPQLFDRFLVLPGRCFVSPEVEDIGEQSYNQSPEVMGYRLFR